jgi:Ca2+-binding RTX toxin-like protein
MISRIQRTDLAVLRRRDFNRWLHRSHCERLEPRRLLASVSVQSGVLTVNGDNVSETITITPIAGGTVDVDINGNKTFIGNFNSLVVNANGGNDKILLDPNFNWNSTLRGGAGNDSLVGAAAFDVLDGGSGADTLKGGAANDTVDYSSRTAPLTIGLGTLNDDGEAGEKDNIELDIETVLGGSGNDIIRGSGSNNLLVGNGGSDSLFGNYGNDTLVGGAGPDRLDGGPGTDSAQNDGSDTPISIENTAGGGDPARITDRTLFVHGTAGDDQISLVDFDLSTNVRVNASNQTFADADFDKIIVRALNGNDYLSLEYLRTPTQVDAGEGKDVVVAKSTNVSVTGGNGNDLLYLNEDSRAPIFDGGAGSDEIVTDESSDIDLLDLNLYPTVENARLWQGTVIGNALNNGLEVRVGGTLLGNGGNDSLYAGSAALPVYMDGGEGNDSMTGGDANDTLVGGAGSDRLEGRGGNDTVDYSARTANLTIGIGTLADDGEAGEKDNVYLDIETILGGSGNDTIRGGAANNLLVGNGGNDSLFGNFGNDTLQGGGGNDALDGGSDADTLDGGDGTDSGKQSAADVLISIETPT